VEILHLPVQAQPLVDHGDAVGEDGKAAFLDFEKCADGLLMLAETGQRLAANGRKRVIEFPPDVAADAPGALRPGRAVRAIMAPAARRKTT
jgi:hypothetical protein